MNLLLKVLIIRIIFKLVFIIGAFQKNNSVIYLTQ